jgi:hypothetical protein
MTAIGFVHYLVTGANSVTTEEEERAKELADHDRL